MSKEQNRSTGQKGEQIAAEYLKKKGYQILERNWHSKFGEIDIICKCQNPNAKGQTLVFVEVKTKVGDRFGTPEEMANRYKLMRVQRMAMLYEPLLDIARRIDVVVVVLGYTDKVERIDHYIGVY